MTVVLWIVIVVVVLAAIALVAATMRRRRTAMLRQRFGSEYDRALAGHESQRAAEAELRDRERQRSELDIKPLPPASRERFVQEWHGVQERFVDQPAAAAVAADNIVYRVMEERGYPMGDFEDQADLVSVDHPQVVENYRIAHGIQQRAESKQATTEDLRDALLRYRTLFDELLRADEDAPAGDITAGDEARPAIPPGEAGPVDQDIPARQEPGTSGADVPAAAEPTTPARGAPDVNEPGAAAEDVDDVENRPDVEDQPVPGRARQPIRNSGRGEGV